MNHSLLFQYEILVAGVVITSTLVLNHHGVHKLSIFLYYWFLYHKEHCLRLDYSSCVDYFMVFVKYFLIRVDMDVKQSVREIVE